MIQILYRYDTDMIQITEGMTPDQFVNAMNGNFEEPYEISSFTAITKSMTSAELKNAINANLCNTIFDYGVNAGVYTIALNNKFNDILNEVFNIELEDDFNGDSVNTNNWTVIDDAVYPQYYCAMYGDQYYSPTKLSISNGILRIAMTNEAIGEHPYSSGGISTEDSCKITRGRVEVRAKIPKTQGIFPAIWLIEETRPYFIEIDIMERLGHEADHFHVNLHCYQPGHQFSGLLEWGTSKTYTISKGNFSDDYHIWAVDIYDSKIIWWVDGIKVYTYLRGNDPNFTGMPEEGVYLLINGAIGRSTDWSGAPDGTTIFPQNFDIDYVRIYTRL